MHDFLELLGRVLGWLLSWPTLRVRLIVDDPDIEVGGLRFEVENRGDKLTSLDPVIIATFLTVNRIRGCTVFDVRELDRSLPSFTPKIFSASAREPHPDRFHSWFRIYRFSPSRGRTCRLRIKNASLQPMGMFSYWFHRVAFHFGCIFEEKTSATTTEFRAKQRTRGPH
jgi:hypothetical protein